MCEDFAITVLIEFAKENHLPFKFQNGTGLYDAESYHYDNGAERYEPFEHKVLITSGAPDLHTYPINTLKIKSGKLVNQGVLDKNALAKVKAGDVFLLEFNTDNLANHVQLVTGVKTTEEITDEKVITQYNIKIHQGNFPSDPETFKRWIQSYFVSGDGNDPYSTAYYGVAIAEAEYDFSKLIYVRNGNISMEPPTQIFYIVRWNFFEW